eukprot:symbB.v1.2.021852.t1/scaffold1913.1/size122320/8
MPLCCDIDSEDEAWEGTIDLAIFQQVRDQQDKLRIIAKLEAQNRSNRSTPSVAARSPGRPSEGYGTATVNTSADSSKEGGSSGYRENGENKKLQARDCKTGKSMSQLKMLEDENFAEQVMYSNQMRSIKDECTEFDRQYNHVLDRWRLAEENSMSFEMEMRSEAMLFQEARGYINEMQQQFGNVMQEDYGAGLRIQELEGLLSRERATYQTNNERFSREAFQEFAELRDKADRIRLEASEAIAAKDNERIQEKELITDEAKRLHQMNGLLLSELSFAQNDAIQAAHNNSEMQRRNDLLQKKTIEEETYVRNLQGEMNVVQSHLGMETAKSERLQVRNEEDRTRYEQRLNLFMSNPNANLSSNQPSDLASKVEIQRLKQELASAEGALAIVPINPSPSITKEMNEMKRELVEMKNDPGFQRLDQEMFEARQERNVALGEKNDYLDEAREEKSRYWSEEKEARRRQEDIDRLRSDRNEWREHYDELLAQWTAEWDGKGLECSEEGEAHEARSEASEAIASFIDIDRPKISRKEADKVVIPNWPKIHELEYWKSQVTSNIVAACGDLDHDAWVRWIAPSFRQLPDIDGDLAKSGDQRYNSIDVKLASALMSMMQNGGDQAREVLHEAKLKMAKGCMALERAVINPKRGNAKGTLNGTWKIDITVNRDQRANELFVERFYRCEDDDMGNTDLASAYSTVKIQKKAKFIMDTGCGYDLISHRKARELDLDTYEGEDRMVFMTANGITETRTITDCSVDSFEEDPKPFVLDQTPAVFSVGMRCMKQGYTFVWPPGEQPFMINKDGMRIDLHSRFCLPKGGWVLHLGLAPPGGVFMMNL